ncbi:hypothetical protein HDV00_002217 [Rhizophlyctis rosea]|nr:hypothetical protein HDV00_002217 [Rhizophlyctis rosea]
MACLHAVRIGPSNYYEPSVLSNAALLKRVSANPISSANLVFFFRVALPEYVHPALRTEEQLDAALRAAEESRTLSATTTPATTSTEPPQNDDITPISPGLPPPPQPTQQPEKAQATSRGARRA